MLMPLVLPAFALLSALVLPVTAVLLNTYDYEHGWVSAHFATIAKSYLEHGIIALGGVPIQNNPPLTMFPDAYLNWPPLYPLVVSAVFAVFGESEVVHHLLATVINLALGVTLAGLVYRRFGVPAASVTAIAFFNAPILAKYGHVGSQLHLALLLCVISLWLFCAAANRFREGRSSAWIFAAIGCGVFSLSILSSWEPVLAVPGIAVLSLISRDWKSFALSVCYGIVAVVTVSAVFAIYWMQYDYFGDAIMQRIMLRAGFEVAYDPAVSAMFESPHFIQETHEPRGDVNSNYLFKVSFSALLMQGLLGLVGIMMIYKLPIWRRRESLGFVVAGVASIYVLWAVFMRQHMDIHLYQLLVLAPVAAICAGVLIGLLLSDGAGFRYPDFTARRTMLLVLLVPAVALAMKAPVALNLFENHNPAASGEITFARQINRLTEPGSIVVHADRSMVPVYYSDRHVIRSVRDEQTFGNNREAIETLCADCPIYLAVPDEYRDRFAEFIAANDPLSGDAGGVLFKLR